MLDQNDFFRSRRVAPDFESGVAGFQTRENALPCNDRALALVRMARGGKPSTEAQQPCTS